MHRNISVVSILLIIALIYSPVAATAQQSASSGEWASVQAVPTGDELSIKLKDGQTVRGKLTSVTDMALSITRKNKTETLDRNNISEVYQLRRKAEKGKYALIGAGVGAAVGGGIGKSKESSESDDSEIYTVIGVALGAGIGAVGGLLFGQGKRKRVLIYQAR